MVEKATLVENMEFFLQKYLETFKDEGQQHQELQKQLAELKKQKQNLENQQLKAQEAHDCAHAGPLLRIAEEERLGSNQGKTR